MLSSLVGRPSNSLGLSTFEEIDRLFDNTVRQLSLPSSSFNLPSVDIYREDDGHMVMELPAAGFDEKDIDIQVRDGVLEIRGQRSESHEEGDKKRNYVVRESSAGFARRIVLPEGANSDDITAELDKGLLKIRVPVAQPEAKRITIGKAGGKSLKA